MEALSLQTLLRLHSSPSTIPSYVEKDQSKNNVARNLHERFHPPPAKTSRRRLFLQFMGFCPVLAHPVFAAPVPEIKERNLKSFDKFSFKTVKLPSGVRIQGTDCAD